MFSRVQTEGVSNICRLAEAGLDIQSETFQPYVVCSGCGVFSKFRQAENGYALLWFQ